MKKCIQLESDILCHDSIIKLYAAQKLRGIGLYLMLRLFIRGQSDSGLPLDKVIRFGCGYAYRPLVKSILYDYGLFDIKDGVVKVVTLKVNSEREEAET